MGGLNEKSGVGLPVGTSGVTHLGVPCGPPAVRQMLGGAVCVLFAVRRVSIWDIASLLTGLAGAHWSACRGGKGWQTPPPVVLKFEGANFLAACGSEQYRVQENTCEKKSAIDTEDYFAKSLHGGGAVKAARVCRLVLPGGRTCLPFEEGILHSSVGGGGGVRAHPLGRGWNGRGAGAGGGSLQWCRVAEGIIAHPAAGQNA